MKHQLSFTIYLKYFLLIASIFLMSSCETWKPLKKNIEGGFYESTESFGLTRMYKGEKLLLENDTKLSFDIVESVKKGADTKENYKIDLKFTEKGADLFLTLCSKNMGKYIAIMVNDTIISKIYLRYPVKGDLITIHSPDAKSRDYILNKIR